MAKYKKVGEGSFGVYEKQKADWSGVIGGIAVIAFLLVVIF